MVYLPQCSFPFPDDTTRYDKSSSKDEIANVNVLRRHCSMIVHVEARAYAY